MTNDIFVKIPYSKIRNIEIYRNPMIDGTRKSAAKIKEETGADYIINGTLYEMRTGKAVCPLKAKGVVDCETLEKYWGYAWNTGDMASFSEEVVPSKWYENYIACVELINKQTGPVEKPIFPPDMGGKRGRTALGTYKGTGDQCGGIVLYVASDKDGASEKKTPYQLRDYLHSKGCDSAIMLDGGGSSQGIFGPENKRVSSVRKVPHYILVFLDHGEQAEDPAPDDQEEAPEDQPREVLDLSRYVLAITSIARKNNVPWDVGIDMFIANMQNSQSPDIPAYPGADGVDYRKLWDVWSNMSGLEQSTAYTAYVKWYNKRLREERYHGI